ncbi:hypothetical protein BX265_0136 [Streptomyces sp. TLI_235]|nr:hypothetical protein BX265_0136 [Streptomyces sp. TLI_235]
MNHEESAAFGPAVPGAGGGDPLSGHPFFVRLARAGQRLRRVDRDHPWILDTTVVAVVFLVFCLPELVHGDGGEGPREHRIAFTPLPVPAMLALQAGLLVPLLWRRRRPTAAFAAVLAVFVLQWAIGAVLRADVALLVALYSLALHGRLRHLAWACGAAAGGTALVAVRLSAAVSVWDSLFFLFAAATAPSPWGSRYGSGGRNWPGCVSVRRGWRSSGTSAVGWRRRPSGRGWRGRCTTSSATTCR